MKREKGVGFHTLPREKVVAIAAEGGRAGNGNKRRGLTRWGRGWWAKRIRWPDETQKGTKE